MLRNGLRTLACSLVLLVLSGCPDESEETFERPSPALAGSSRRAFRRHESFPGAFGDRFLGHLVDDRLDEFFGPAAQASRPLSTEQVQALDLRGLVDAISSGVDIRVAQISIGQLRDLGLEDFLDLAGNGMKNIPPELLNEFTTPHVLLLDIANLNDLCDQDVSDSESDLRVECGAERVVKLPKFSISEISIEDVPNMRRVLLKALSFAQVQSMGDEQLHALKKSQIDLIRNRLSMEQENSLL